MVEGWVLQKVALARSLRLCVDLLLQMRFHWVLWLSLVSFG